MKQRPVSRTLSERTQHFEEIRLDSPDMGGDDGDVPEGNNNVIKMRTLRKGKEEPPSEKKPPEEESSSEVKNILKTATLVASFGSCPVHNTFPSLTITNAA